MEVNTDDEEIHLWWSDTGCNTAGDLYEKIKKNVKMKSPAKNMTFFFDVFLIAAIYTMKTK